MRLNVAIQKLRGINMNQQAGLETSKGLVTNVNNRRFGLRDKMGYLFGDFGNDFSFILASSFLMVFYTDVYGISAAAVGGLFSLLAYGMQSQM